MKLFNKQEVLPNLFINLTFTSFEGSYISLITHMNQSVVSEQTAT